MSIILVGNVVTHMYLGLNAMLRSTNRPQKAMYATFGTVILNCVLAPIFIFVLNWGIRGAATATILAQLMMLMWQLRLFSNKSDLIHLSRKNIKLDLRLVRESFQYLIASWPTIIELLSIYKRLKAFESALDD